MGVFLSGLSGGVERYVLPTNEVFYMAKTRVCGKHYEAHVLTRSTRRPGLVGAVWFNMPGAHGAQYFVSPTLHAERVAMEDADWLTVECTQALRRTARRLRAVALGREAKNAQLNLEGL